MECDDEQPGKKFMAPNAIPSITVSLHPLVIMNVSEHWTRVRAQNGTPQQVIGALIGKQRSRVVEITNSFELLVIADVIDEEYYKVKENHFKQVFAEMDFVGWYTTGDDEGPVENDLKNHEIACRINESAIMLKLNPTAGHTDLPIDVYESIIDIVNGNAATLFVQVPYRMATEEAERIGIDHVARMSGEGDNASVVAQHLMSQYNAIKLLHSRVKMILDYVKAVQAGELPRNRDVLRELTSVTQRIPVMNSQKFNAEFYQQCNDVAIIAYLGLINKSCNNTNQLVNKFNVFFDRRSTNKGLR